MGLHSQNTERPDGGAIQAKETPRGILIIRLVIASVIFAVSVADYRNVRLKLAYEMKNRQGETVCTAESEHCFINGNGNLIVLKKQFPKLHEDLMNAMEQARLSY